MEVSGKRLKSTQQKNLDIVKLGIAEASYRDVAGNLVASREGVDVVLPFASIGSNVDVHGWLVGVRERPHAVGQGGLLGSKWHAGERLSNNCMWARR